MILSKRFDFRCNFERPPSWKDGAVNLREWELWDRRERRRLGWMSGIKFWAKTNVEGSRVLLSRHWPHRLCWSWAVWVGVNRPNHDGPHKFVFNVSRRDRHAHIRLWSVYARLSWQDSDWMVGLNHKTGSPKIIWDHHLRSADPAGAA